MTPEAARHLAEPFAGIGRLSAYVARAAERGATHTTVSLAELSLLSVRIRALTDLAQQGTLISSADVARCMACGSPAAEGHVPACPFYSPEVP